MSYDIYLAEPPDGLRAIEFEERHQLCGGTFAGGGTKEAWLNITYNYAKHFYNVLGEEGIRSIYGLTGEETIPMLQAAAGKLANDVDPNYWKATEGNARKALLDLVQLAEMRPDGIWRGD